MWQWHPYPWNLEAWSAQLSESSPSTSRPLLSRPSYWRGVSPILSVPPTKSISVFNVGSKIPGYVCYERLPIVLGQHLISFLEGGRHSQGQDCLLAGCNCKVEHPEHSVDLIFYSFYRTALGHWAAPRPCHDNGAMISSGTKRAVCCVPSCEADRSLSGSPVPTSGLLSYSRPAQAILYLYL